MATVAPLFVSNNILELAFRENIPVTPMKLQKLLYFLYRDYLKKTNEPLFADRFETWKYGPVLSEVYYEFARYRDREIKEFYIDRNGKCYKVRGGSNPIFDSVLNEVWNKYKNYSGIQLSNITHLPNTAWRKAWQSNKNFLSDEDIYAEKVE